jgi:hypothetical protein
MDGRQLPIEAAQENRMLFDVQKISLHDRNRVSMRHCKFTKPDTSESTQHQCNITTSAAKADQL